MSEASSGVSVGICVWAWGLSDLRRGSDVLKWQKTSEPYWCKTIQSQQEILWIWISRTGRLPTSHPGRFLFFAFNQRENKRFILRYGFSLTLELEPSVSIHTVYVFRQLFVNTNKVFGLRQHEADGLLSVVQTQQQKLAPLDSCSLAKLSSVAGGGFLLN